MSTKSVLRRARSRIRPTVKDSAQTETPAPEGVATPDGQDTDGQGQPADPVAQEFATLGEAGQLLQHAWGDSAPERLEAAKTTARSILGDVSPEARMELIEAFDAMPAREQAKVFQRLAGNAAPARKGAPKVPHDIDAQIETKRAERNQAMAWGKHDKAKQLDAELMDLYRLQVGPDELRRNHFEGRIPASALARNGL